ncbi:MAG: hypothetical protein DRQ40_10335 [Gammaproteobacteria bacterium]|nr:MAG: hypothetical protein DRQ40_10335 [Gammaproteobacteria bacterium]
MFKASIWRPTAKVVAVSGIFVLSFALSGSVADAGVAATDFGDPSDAPFVANRGVNQGVPNAIHNLDTGEFFSTLQAALDDVDTVNGHVLQLEVASLPEGQVLITKNVTIQGQTGSEQFVATVNTGSAGDTRGWFLIETGVSVVVQDLHFDGAGFLIWQALRVKGSADVARCSFSDIQYNPSSDYAGTAVALVGAGEVVDCDFSQIGRVGVLFYGPGVTSGLMQRCSFSGKGAGDWLDYAVEVGAGAYALVRDNYFDTCRGVASSDASESSGVNVNTTFADGTVADVLSNTVMDCTFGVQIGRGNGQGPTAEVHFNRLITNEFGVGINSPSPLSATNNWFGCNEGPGQPGCDATDGDPLIDPWLTLTITANPTTIQVFQDSAVESALIINSDAVDTSGVGLVPDAIPETFTATLGAVNPVAGGTVDGLVPTVFTAGGVLGTAIVTVTCDNETVETPIEIVARAEAIPTLGFWALLMLMTAVAVLGARILIKR